jgi:hypothetical protein
MVPQYRENHYAKEGVQMGKKGSKVAEQALLMKSTWAI